MDTRMRIANAFVALQQEFWLIAQNRRLAKSMLKEQ